MRVLLYGGSFDPPHNGHIHNIQSAVACVQPDEIIIMPSGVPPHKQASKTAAALRYEMCGCFAVLFAGEGAPKCTISEWEIEQAKNGSYSYTVQTLRMLKQRYPQAELYFCMGSDMLLSFTTWYCWQEILELATILVESREIGDEEQLLAAAKTLGAAQERIVVMQDPAMPMASKELRQKYQRGEDCSEYVPPIAAAVIAREGLYQQR